MSSRNKTSDSKSIHDDLIDTSKFKNDRKLNLKQKSDVGPHQNAHSRNKKDTGSKTRSREKSTDEKSHRRKHKEHSLENQSARSKQSEDKEVQTPRSRSRKASREKSVYNKKARNGVDKATDPLNLINRSTTGNTHNLAKTKDSLIKLEGTLIKSKQKLQMKREVHASPERQDVGTKAFILRHNECQVNPSKRTIYNGVSYFFKSMFSKSPSFKNDEATTSVNQYRNVKLSHLTDSYKEHNEADPKAIKSKRSVSADPGASRYPEKKFVESKHPVKDPTKKHKKRHPSANSDHTHKYRIIEEESVTKLEPAKQKLSKGSSKEAKDSDSVSKTKKDRRSSRSFRKSYSSTHIGANREHNLRDETKPKTSENKQKRIKNRSKSLFASTSETHLANAFMSELQAKIEKRQNRNSDSIEKHESRRKESKRENKSGTKIKINKEKRDYHDEVQKPEAQRSDCPKQNLAADSNETPKHKSRKEKYLAVDSNIENPDHKSRKKNLSPVDSNIENSNHKSRNEKHAEKKHKHRSSEKKNSNSTVKIISSEVKTSASASEVVLNTKPARTENFGNFNMLSMYDKNTKAFNIPKDQLDLFVNHLKVVTQSKNPKRPIPTQKKLKEPKVNRQEVSFSKLNVQPITQKYQLPYPFYSWKSDEVDHKSVASEEVAKKDKFLHVNSNEVKPLQCNLNERRYPQLDFNDRKVLRVTDVKLAQFHLPERPMVDGKLAQQHHTTRSFIYSENVVESRQKMVHQGQKCSFTVEGVEPPMMIRSRESASDSIRSNLKKLHVSVLSVLEIKSSLPHQQVLTIEDAPFVTTIPSQGQLEESVEKLNSSAESTPTNNKLEESVQQLNPRRDLTPKKEELEDSLKQLHSNTDSTQIGNKLEESVTKLPPQSELIISKSKLEESIKNEVSDKEVTETVTKDVSKKSLNFPVSGLQNTVSSNDSNMSQHVQKVTSTTTGRNNSRISVKNEKNPSNALIQAAAQKLSNPIVADPPEGYDFPKNTLNKEDLANLGHEMLNMMQKYLGTCSSPITKERETKKMFSAAGEDFFSNVRNCIQQRLKSVTEERSRVSVEKAENQAIKLTRNLTSKPIIASKEKVENYLKTSKPNQLTFIKRKYDENLITSPGTRARTSKYANKLTLKLNAVERSRSSEKCMKDRHRTRPTFSCSSLSSSKQSFGSKKSLEHLSDMSTKSNSSGFSLESKSESLYPIIRNFRTKTPFPIKEPSATVLIFDSKKLTANSNTENFITDEIDLLPKIAEETASQNSVPRIKSDSSSEQKRLSSQRQAKVSLKCDQMDLKLKSRKVVENQSKLAADVSLNLKNQQHSRRSPSRLLEKQMNLEAQANLKKTQAELKSVPSNKLLEDPDLSKPDPKNELDEKLKMISQDISERFMQVFRMSTENTFHLPFSMPMPASKSFESKATDVSEMRPCVVTKTNVSKTATNENATPCNFIKRNINQIKKNYDSDKSSNASSTMDHSSKKCAVLRILGSTLGSRPVSRPLGSSSKKDKKKEEEVPMDDLVRFTNLLKDNRNSASNIEKASLLDKIISENISKILSKQVLPPESPKKLKRPLMRKQKTFTIKKPAPVSTKKQLMMQKLQVLIADDNNFSAIETKLNKILTAEDQNADVVLTEQVITKPPINRESSSKPKRQFVKSFSKSEFGSANIIQKKRTTTPVRGEDNQELERPSTTPSCLKEAFDKKETESITSKKELTAKNSKIPRFLRMSSNSINKTRPGTSIAESNNSKASLIRPPNIKTSLASSRIGSANYKEDKPNESGLSNFEKRKRYSESIRNKTMTSKSEADKMKQGQCGRPFEILFVTSEGPALHPCDPLTKYITNFEESQSLKKHEECECEYDPYKIMYGDDLELEKEKSAEVELGTRLTKYATEPIIKAKVSEDRLRKRRRLSLERDLDAIRISETVTYDQDLNVSVSQSATSMSSLKTTSKESVCDISSRSFHRLSDSETSSEEVENCRETYKRKTKRKNLSNTKHFLGDKSHKPEKIASSCHQSKFLFPTAVSLTKLRENPKNFTQQNYLCHSHGKLKILYENFKSPGGRTSFKDSNFTKTLNDWRRKRRFGVGRWSKLIRNKLTRRTKGELNKKLKSSTSLNKKHSCQAKVFKFRSGSTSSSKEEDQEDGVYTIFNYIQDLNEDSHDSDECYKIYAYNSMIQISNCELNSKAAMLSSTSATGISSTSLNICEISESGYDSNISKTVTSLQRFSSNEENILKRLTDFSNFKRTSHQNFCICPVEVITKRKCCWIGNQTPQSTDSTGNQESSCRKCKTKKTDKEVSAKSIKVCFKPCTIDTSTSAYENYYYPRTDAKIKEIGHNCNTYLQSHRRRKSNRKKHSLVPSNQNEPSIYQNSKSTFIAEWNSSNETLCDDQSCTKPCVICFKDICLEKPSSSQPKSKSVETLCDDQSCTKPCVICSKDICLEKPSSSQPKSKSVETLCDDQSCTKPCVICSKDICLEKPSSSQPKSKSVKIYNRTKSESQNQNQSQSQKPQSPQTCDAQTCTGVCLDPLKKTESDECGCLPMRISNKLKHIAVGVSKTYCSMTCRFPSSERENKKSQRHHQKERTESASRKESRFKQLADFAELPLRILLCNPPKGCNRNTCSRYAQAEDQGLPKLKVLDEDYKVQIEPVKKKTRTICICTDDLNPEMAVYTSTRNVPGADSLKHNIKDMTKESLMELIKQQFRESLKEVLKDSKGNGLMFCENMEPRPKPREPTQQNFHNDTTNFNSRIQSGSNIKGRVTINNAVFLPENSGSIHEPQTILAHRQSESQVSESVIVEMPGGMFNSNVGTETNLPSNQSISRITVTISDSLSCEIPETFDSITETETMLPNMQPENRTTEEVSFGTLEMTKSDTETLTILPSRPWDNRLRNAISIGTSNIFKSDAKTETEVGSSEMFAETLTTVPGRTSRSRIIEAHNSDTNSHQDTRDEVTRFNSIKVNNEPEVHNSNMEFSQDFRDKEMKFSSIKVNNEPEAHNSNIDFSQNLRDEETSFSPIKVNNEHEVLASPTTSNPETCQNLNTVLRNEIKNSEPIEPQSQVNSIKDLLESCSTLDLKKLPKDVLLKLKNEIDNCVNTMLESAPLSKSTHSLGDETKRQAQTEELNEEPIQLTRESNKEFGTFKSCACETNSMSFLGSMSLDLNQTGSTISEKANVYYNTALNVSSKHHPFLKQSCVSGPLYLPDPHELTQLCIDSSSTMPKPKGVSKKNQSGLLKGTSTSWKDVINSTFTTMLISSKEALDVTSKEAHCQLLQSLNKLSVKENPSPESTRKVSSKIPKSKKNRTKETKVLEVTEASGTLENTASVKEENRNYNQILSCTQPLVDGPIKPPLELKGAETQHCTTVEEVENDQSNSGEPIKNVTSTVNLRTFSCVSLKEVEASGNLIRSFTFQPQQNYLGDTNVSPNKLSETAENQCGCFPTEPELGLTQPTSSEPTNKSSIAEIQQLNKIILSESFQKINCKPSDVTEILINLTELIENNSQEMLNAPNRFLTMSEKELAVINLTSESLAGRLDVAFNHSLMKVMKLPELTSEVAMRNAFRTSVSGMLNKILANDRTIENENLLHELLSDSGENPFDKPFGMFARVVVVMTVQQMPHKSNESKPYFIPDDLLLEMAKVSLEAIIQIFKKLFPDTDPNVSFKEMIEELAKQKNLVAEGASTKSQIEILNLLNKKYSLKNNEFVPCNCAWPPAKPLEITIPTISQKAQSETLLQVIEPKGERPVGEALKKEHPKGKNSKEGISKGGSCKSIEPKNMAALEDMRKSFSDKEVFDKMLHIYEMEENLAKRLSQDDEFFLSQLKQVKSKESIEIMFQQGSVTSLTDDNINQTKFNMLKTAKPIIKKSSESLTPSEFASQYILSLAPDEMVSKKVNTVETSGYSSKSSKKTKSNFKTKMGRLFKRESSVKDIVTPRDDDVFRKESMDLSYLTNSNESENSSLFSSESKVKFQGKGNELSLDESSFLAGPSVKSPEIGLHPSEIGRCFLRGFRTDNLTLSGKICLPFTAEEQAQLRAAGKDVSIVDFSERDTPLDFLLALGYSIDEASNAIKDEDVKLRLSAAVTEARIWINQIKSVQGTLLYLIAYKAKPRIMRYYLQLVEAIINVRINNAVKLDAFLKLLEKVENGDLAMINIIGTDKLQDEDNDEKIVKKQLRDIFISVYKVADLESKKRHTNIVKNQLFLLRILAAQYRAGLNSHLELIAKYIGQNLLSTEVQLEAAMIYLSRLDSDYVNLEEFEQYCAIDCKRKHQLDIS